MTKGCGTEPEFKTGWPRTYAFDLQYPQNYPQASASPVNQQYRYGLLYQTTLPGPGNVLRTTRQFFGAKGRPDGYIADGRELFLHISDSIPTGFTLRMNDSWISDGSGGRPVSMRSRDFSKHRLTTLHEATDLLRTECFETSDSAEIGVEFNGRFYGDSSLAGNAGVDVIVELVDSVSDAVVYTMDSLHLTSSSDSVHVLLHPEYDLLSGTYFIRTRVDTANLSVVPRVNESTYPVAECASEVGEVVAAKFVMRMGSATEAGYRISAQPNPFGDRTEVRFSIPRRDYVSVTVYDALGGEVSKLLDGELFDAGRYALDFDGGELPGGTYLIELRTSDERRVEKTILRR